jgi:hypothetical protein
VRIDELVLDGVGPFAAEEFAPALEQELAPLLESSGGERPEKSAAHPPGEAPYATAARQVGEAIRRELV